MKPHVKRQYTGKSGHLAVMAELLARECNVAIPEVDVGEDLFTFQDGKPPIDRIQVKTANARRVKKHADRYSAEISVPLTQLRTPGTPALHSIFPIRLEDRWVDYVVISRENLNLLQEQDQVGIEGKKELRLRLNFDPESSSCKGCDLSEFRNAWNRLPILES